MEVPPDNEYVLRSQLLLRFAALGYHPRLLHLLRGGTPEGEWTSLERLLSIPPDRLKLEEIFHGNWRKWWALSQEPGSEE